jgi:hypothetical protein
MDELRNRFSPTFSSAAVGHQHTASFRTTMAGKRRVPPSHRATSPEKEMLLIEEGFPNFASIAAPPP